MFLALVGQFSKALMRYLSVGALFLIVITYAALVLINLLGCIWFFTATIEGLDSSWLNVCGARLSPTCGKSVCVCLAAVMGHGCVVKLEPA